MFRKLALFLSSGEGREPSTLWGPLERANVNHWISGIGNFGWWTQSRNPVILSVIDHRHNPLDSASILFHIFVCPWLMISFLFYSTLFNLSCLITN
jgi:hypothetical protein